MSNLRSANEFLNVVNVKLPTDVMVKPNALMSNDSRELNSGDVFCAVIGTEADGRHYINQALDKNVALVIAQCEQSTQHGEITTLQNQRGDTVYQVTVYQLNQQLFELASRFYNNPQQNMLVCGVTGTNGKTSISQLIAQLFSLMTVPCAIVGTNGAGLPGQLTPVNNTTPGATELLGLLAQFADQDIHHVAMEVSSHALDQRRVNSSLFDVAVFSNLSRDHLDYHQTMDAYAQAKFALFTQRSDQIAVINGDDEIAQQWLTRWPELNALIVYGRSEKVAQYNRFLQAKHIKHTQSGARFEVLTESEHVVIESPLLGDFNVDNLLAAIAVLLSQNVSLDKIALYIPKLRSVDGRMETFKAANTPLVLVDYAHTPDALEKVLIAAKAHCQGNLWVVFGCGGDRDKGKRPLMAKIAERLADKVMVTSDNPRTEQPISIINDVLKGFKQPEEVMTEIDRAAAIKHVIAQAVDRDIVVLAGKGHEDYIIIGDNKHPFDERALVKQLLNIEVDL